MPFQKGYTPWNKGKKCPQISEARKGMKFSEEHRRNLSRAKKGQKPWNTGKKRPPLSDEWRTKISEAHKANPIPTQFKKGHKTWIKGLTKETDEKVRKIAEMKIGRPRPDVRGENHWNWKGGKIPYYGSDWYYQRRLVRERDNYTCLCGLEENGREHDVHHIVPYRISKDNSQDNLWTLCPKCHRKIEGLQGVADFGL